MPVAGEENLTSDADYGLLGMRPEAIAGVPVATRDALRLAGQDRVLAYLGKRAKRPVTEIDYELKRAVIAFAMVNCIRHRGAKPNSEDMRLLSDALEEVKTWLDLVRVGEVEPYFVDSTAAAAEFGPLGGSSPKADDWVDP